MHCDCCDKLLSDWESSLRYKSTGDFVNTCWKCLQGLNIEVTGNPLLKRKKDEFVDEDQAEIPDDIKPIIQEQTSDRFWEDD